MATGEESREKRKLEREGRGRKGKRKRGREGEGEQSTHLSRVRSWCKEYRYAFIAVQAGAGVLLCLCLQVHKIPVRKGRCLVELWHFLRFTFSPVFFFFIQRIVDCVGDFLATHDRSTAKSSPLSLRGRVISPTQRDKIFQKRTLSGLLAMAKVM